MSISFASLKPFALLCQKENAGISSRDDVCIAKAPKKVSLRTVRQFMKLGKSKQQTSRRDSSTEDENR